MKSNLAKRSLALVLVLLMAITTGSAASAAWVADLNAISTTDQEAILHSWDDKALATKDGPYPQGTSSGGKLDNLDYKVDHEDIVGFQYYSDTPNNPVTNTNGAVILDYVATVKWLKPLESAAGKKIRFFYRVFIDGITQETVSTTSGQVGMYFRMYTSNPDQVVVDRWSAKDGDTRGIYNYNSTNHTFGHDKTYGYDYKTIYSQEVDISPEMAERDMTLKIFPSSAWDFYKNPVTIYAVGYEMDGKQYILCDKENLLPFVENHPTASGGKVLCREVTGKKSNLTAVGWEDGPYTILGRRTTQKSFFSETKTYFLFDDFIPYNNMSLAVNDRKMNSDCHDIAVDDDLTINFKIATANASLFDTYNFKINFKARVSTSDNVNIVDVSLPSNMFVANAQNNYTTVVKKHTNDVGEEVIDESISITIRCTGVTNTTIDGVSTPTYEFQVSIFNITQSVISQLQRAGSSSGGGLNLLLGVAGDYDYGEYPITLLMWEVANTTHGKEAKSYVFRSHAKLAYFGGSGPAYEYVYMYNEPKYDPKFMSHCYIPTGKTFSGDDANANMQVDFPHAGEYVLRTDLQGDPGETYTLQIVRKTIKGNEILKKQQFTATGFREIETMAFQVEDLDDSYTIQIVNSTGNNLSVFSIELLCDAQATLNGTLYPDLDWALEDAASGNTVKLVDEVDYSHRAAVAIPAGVTFDLAGHSLRVQNFISFGNVVDGQGLGEGTLVLVDRKNTPTDQAMVALQENNAQLPLYNSADGGYQFFTCTTESAGHKEPATNTIQFGFRVKLPTVKAYDLLKENVNSGAVSLRATVTWTSTAFTYLHGVSQTTMGSYVDTVKKKINGGTAADKVTSAVTLKVVRVHHIGAGNTISCVPSLISPLTGVTKSGTEDQWTYAG